MYCKNYHSPQTHLGPRSRTKSYFEKIIGNNLSGFSFNFTLQSDSRFIDIPRLVRTCSWSNVSNYVSVGIRLNFSMIRKGFVSFKVCFHNDTGQCPCGLWLSKILLQNVLITHNLATRCFARRVLPQIFLIRPSFAPLKFGWRWNGRD